MSSLPTRVLLLATLAGVCCAHVALAAESKPARADLTAAQILEKHIAARGGLQAWHAVKAMSWSGKMDAGTGDSAARSSGYVRNSVAPANKKQLVQQSSAGEAAATSQQVQLPFVLAMERPRKSRLELEFAGKTAIQVYDGNAGWKVRPFLNRNDVEPFTAQETKIVAAKPDLDGPLLDATAEGTRVDVEGVEAVEGHDAYKLKLTTKAGSVQHVWIDAQSFLDVKVEGAQRQMDGRMHNVWVYQRDFRPVQGVLVPFVLETVVDGYRDTHKIVIEKVAVNPKLPADSFSRPKV